MKKPIHLDEVEMRLLGDVMWLSEEVVVATRLQEVVWYDAESGGKTDFDPKVTEVLGPEPTCPSTLSKELPIIEPIALPEHDDKSGSRELIQFYNGMCTVVEANTADAIQAYFGNSSSSSRLSMNLCHLRTMCEDVLRVLTILDCGSAARAVDINENGSLPTESVKAEKEVIEQQSLVSPGI
ncbi:hypothetical protein KSP39_PZI015697 [Platanthera zijinensis]|uniref:Uncharacterized protein n=1 Tax=Platanthera zijinensis TaxID=2320716 RepID=A0AAP0G1P4_9ASPA